MSAIEIIDHLVIYENPIPNLVSRHGYFPGLAKLPSGDLLVLFPVSEAFEAVMTIFVSRSRDQGQTWTMEGPMHEDSDLGGPGSMKPTVLGDGSLIALGYSFKRDDPEVLVNSQTGGLPDGANYVAFSDDEGRAWSRPEKISLTHPDAFETSGPCIELRNGDLIATGPPFPRWDGSMPSGLRGFLLRSRDKGKTWDDKTVYYEEENISPYECRQCEMQDGRIVIMIWCLDEEAGRSLANHVVVSHDNGITWSDPIDTGTPGQASNLMYLGGDLLLAVHCYREGDTGLYVHVVDFADDKWRVLSRAKVWGKVPPMHIGKLSDMGKGLKFGQASLLQLDNSDILVTHWAVEDGQGRILTHRIRLDLDQL